MKSAIMIINLFFWIQLNGQFGETKRVEIYDLDIAYNVAQHQYNTGIIQSNLANNWGVTTTILSAISLIGYATSDDQSSAHSISYWGAMTSMGAAAVGLVIKISSIEKISHAQSEMNKINYDKYSGFGSLDLGTTENGIGFTYTF